MENSEVITELQRISKDLESQRNVLSHVVSLLMNLSNVVDEGFNKVNERLAALEGKQGMQGVNQQLGDIKNELHKIQRTYPYDDMFKNILSIGVADA